MSHLTFEEMDNPGRKTKLFSVKSNHDGTELGIIRWRTGWRCYVFAPLPDCDWSDDCLDDLSAKLKQLRDERKKEKEDEQ